MKRALLICLSAALALSLSAQAAKPTKPTRSKTATSGPKKIYCWEEKGVRVCGDALPASALNNARTEINGATGLATKHVDRVLTEEERMAAERAAQAAAAQQQQQVLLSQQQQQLVISYADEAAFNRGYDEKEAAVKATIAETQKTIDSIRQVLLKKLDLAGEMELAKKPVPAKSVKSIADLHAQVRGQEAIKARQQQTLDALRVVRAADLLVFRSAVQARTNASAGLPIAPAPGAGAPSTAAPATAPAQPPIH